MAFDEGALDSEPTQEQRHLIAGLTEKEVGEIDACILSCVSGRWSKVSKVVADAMHQMPERIAGIPDVYYAQRVWQFVEQGRLEHQGFLGRMRYCEVRVKLKKHNNKLQPSAYPPAELGVRHPAIDRGTNGIRS